MDITSEVFYNKIKVLRPNLQSAVTPHTLNKLCNERSVQPFLKWFCENVTSSNVLSNEEIQIKNEIEKSGEWLTGEELDDALRKATQDCPELLNIATLDDYETEIFYTEFELAKGECQENEDYVNDLNTAIQNLKEIEDKLDEETEKHENFLEKTSIETEKTFNDCFTLLEEFDNGNRKFSENVEHLLNVYAEAAENRGAQILWTQMPIELFAKQIQLYNDYLRIHLKQQFETSDKEKYTSDSDYSNLINDSKDEQIEEKIQELTFCKTSLVASKLNALEAKIKEHSFAAMLEYARNIYNNGNTKIPEKSRLRDEILDLTGKRDLLKEKTKLLRERQLYELVQQFGELEITKALKNNACAKLQRRENRIKKLKHLLSLAREHGHAHSDLLCILMEMQYRCVKNVRELVADARHYLDTEYSLSCSRSECMQQRQDEYNALISSPAYNSFDKLFISMMSENGTTENSLSIALKKYNELIFDNEKKKRKLVDAYINAKIENLELMEFNINSLYTNEISHGPTRSLKPVCYTVDVKSTEVFNEVQNVQAEVTEIRNKLKEQKKTSMDLDREKKILWQWYLADPDTLREKYNEIKARAEQSHFGSTSDR